MAVVNKYVNSDLESGTLAKVAFTNVGTVYEAIAIADIDAADDDTSVYRLFKSVPDELVPISITATNDAITGGTDYDLGFYEVSSAGKTGAVIDKDALADGVDMSSARAEGSGITLLDAVALADSQKRLFEIAGDTQDTKKGAYDIALTANTVGTATGKIVVKARFLQA